VGPSQKLPGVQQDRSRSPIQRAPAGATARKDFAPGVGGGRSATGNRQLPAFSFTRDDDRDFLAGSIRWGDRRFSFSHRGDDFYRHRYNHWLFRGGDCSYGYRYPYHHYYRYPGYRYCSPYYSGLYSPYYSPYYVPYWYSVPTFGYSYVSAYYDVPYADSYVEYVPSYGTDVVYEAEPYVQESYVPRGSDSVVIYEADSVYVDGDRGQSGEPPISEQPWESPAYRDEPVLEEREPAPIGPQAAPPEQGADAGWGPILTEGNEAFAAGNFEAAQRHYLRAVSADERDGYAQMLHAWATFALRDYGSAAQSIRRAIAVSADLVDYPIDIRSMYGDPQAFEGQLNALRDHVLDRPEEDATFVLGYLHYSIGEPDKAAALFDRLAQGQPGNDLYPKLLRAAARGQEILRAREQQAPTGTPEPQ